MRVIRILAFDSRSGSRFGNDSRFSFLVSRIVLGLSSEILLCGIEAT